MANDIQPMVISSMELRCNLMETASALGFYLLAKEDTHKQSYQQYLSKLKHTFDKLRKLPQYQHDQFISKTINDVESNVNIFAAYEGHKVELAENIGSNFSTMAYSADKLKPISRNILQTFFDMVLSETE